MLCSTIFSCSWFQSASHFALSAISGMSFSAWVGPCVGLVFCVGLGCGVDVGACAGDGAVWGGEPWTATQPLGLFHQDIPGFPYGGPGGGCPLTQPGGHCPAGQPWGGLPGCPGGGTGGGSAGAGSSWAGPLMLVAVPDIWVAICELLDTAWAVPCWAACCPACCDPRRVAATARSVGSMALFFGGSGCCGGVCSGCF